MSEDLFPGLETHPAEVIKSLRKELCDKRDSGLYPPSTDDLWKAVLKFCGRRKVSPTAWRALWNEVHSENEAGGSAATGGKMLPTGASPSPPPAMWFPDREAQNLSALALWMKETGHRDFASFRQWSLDQREEFWESAAKRLHLVFETRGQKTLDLHKGPANAIWFPGSRLNIVASCFQAPAESVAILSARTDGVLRRVSSGELKRQVSVVVAAIRAAGFVPGDRLGVVLPLTPDSVALYLAIIAAGCIAVSIADSFAPPEIDNRLRIAKALAVFTYDVQVRNGKILPLYERVQEATRLPVIVLPDSGQELQVSLRGGDQSWTDFLESATRGNADWHVAPSDTPINVLFSSGTTGDPKAIPWTQLTPLKCAVDGLVHQDLRSGQVVCWPTSLGWMMGPWLIFATLLNRGTLALYEDAPMGAGFGKFVQDTRVNMLGVVPTIVRHWRESRVMEPFDWSAINVFSSTGESSRADDMFYLSSLANMRPVIEYCGGTEIGGGYISQTVLHPNRPAVFSTPAAGLDFVILDAENQPADEGELFLIPPAIGLSSSLLNRDHADAYYRGAPACPAVGTASGVAPRPDAVLRRHGDHFRRLPGGCFAAGGRVDDTMNLGGIKTSSAEIERVLNQVPGVRETAAVAWAESGGPDELHVFFVPSGEPSASDLKAAFNAELKRGLNPLFRVNDIHRVESLPRTASNKVMRRLLRDRLDGQKP